MQWSPDDTANEERAVRQVLTTFKTTWLLRYGDTCIAIDRVGFVRHTTTDIIHVMYLQHRRQHPNNQHMS